MHAFIHSIALIVSRLMTRYHTASTAEAPGSLASESFQPTRFANMSLFFPSNMTVALRHPSRSIPCNLPFRPARSTGTISTAIGNAARRGAVGLLLALAALAFLPTAAQAQTAPSQPRSVTAGEGDGRIVLQWAAPAEYGGSAITGYEFRRRFPNGGDWQTIPGGAEARSHTVTNLTNGQSHSFALRARNENGPGDQVNVSGAPHAGAPGLSEIYLDTPNEPVTRCYRWRKEFGGLKLDQAKRLKELEKENARLKRPVAELSLERQVLRDVAQGHF